MTYETTPRYTMTKEQYRAALGKLELNHVSVKEVLGIKVRQSQRYASGDAPVSGPVERLLNELLKRKKR